MFPGKTESLRSGFLLLALLLCCGISAFSQETLVDELFTEGGDITEQTNPAQAEVLVEAPEPLPYVLSGTISTMGGISAGYLYTPWDERFTGVLDLNAGLTAVSYLTLTSRPDNQFGYFFSLKAVFDPFISGNAQWTNFFIDTIYCEYIMADYVFWKLGKYEFTWGQGRIFNPGNFMSDSASLYTVQAAFPTWLSGVTAWMQFSDNQFSDPSVPLHASTVYAIKAEVVLWDTYFGLSGRSKPSEGMDLLFSAKKSIAGIDIHGDCVVNLPSFTTFTGSFLAGFYKQWGDLHLYGEYELLDFMVPTHYSGLALGYNNIGGSSIDPVVKWMHCWSDGSGTLNAGIKWDIMNHVKVETGISLVYGTDTSVYVSANENPGGDRLMLAMLVTLSGGF